MQNPPTNPDIRHQIKQRLMALRPRAFELFAGDLLVYVGLQNVVITRYVSDGGIDAYGDLISESGLMRVAAGVQVKRHRQNVQRADIDRFIGALGGQFHYGIFITTSGYAHPAQTKAASSPLIHLDTIDGNQVIDLMLKHRLGLQTDFDSSAHLDENYFLGFEDQVLPCVSEKREPYDTSSNLNPDAPRPEDDLISLRALSYALRIDSTTIRDWIERGKLVPDRSPTGAGREGFFFRRDRIEAIRSSLSAPGIPITSSEWRQEFVDFARSRQMSKSYKPVLLKALLKVVDRNGVAKVDAVVEAFHSFYLERERQSLPLEFGNTIFQNGANIPPNTIKNLIIKNPLDRFIIKGFLEYDKHDETIRFVPQLWNELRFYELMDILSTADEQLNYYYNRGK